MVGSVVLLGHQDCSRGVIGDHAGDNWKFGHHFIANCQIIKHEIIILPLWKSLLSHQGRGHLRFIRVSNFDRLLLAIVVNRIVIREFFKFSLSILSQIVFVVISPAGDNIPRFFQNRSQRSWKRIHIMVFSMLLHVWITHLSPSSYTPRSFI